jgi:hypothetical protein
VAVFRRRTCTANLQLPSLWLSAAAPDEQLKQMHAKNIFFDFTPTAYGGFFMKIMELSIMLSR